MNFIVTFEHFTCWLRNSKQTMKT